MKRGLVLVCLFLLTVGFSPPIFGADLKVGVVDLQRCIQESQEGKRIAKELEAKKAALQKKIDQKQDELTKLKEELETKGMMLSLDAQEDKRKEFERKRREFQFLYEDLSEEMRLAEADARRKILSDLEKVVQELGKKEGISIIFERRSSGIMFVENGLDLTDKAIKAYDASSPGQGTKGKK
ncbi:MAG: OmpH family outer membrane protein [Desulfatiglandales bacterium]